MQYLRARYYDPASGRFLGRDPVPGGNPYAYAGNNPVNFTDPTGLCIICPPIPWNLCHIPFAKGNCKDTAEKYAPYVEYLKGAAYECGVWGTSAFVVSGLNFGAAGVGCATGTTSYFVAQFTSNPLAQCLVWGAGGLVVASVAAEEALSQAAASRATVGGCISGAGSILLQGFGVNSPEAQCVNWAIGGLIAVSPTSAQKAWDSLLAASVGCAAGALDYVSPGEGHSS
jgi:hypothetical protein